MQCYQAIILTSIINEPLSISVWEAQCQDLLCFIREQRRAKGDAHKKIYNLGLTTHRCCSRLLGILYAQ